MSVLAEPRLTGLPLPGPAAVSTGGMRLAVIDDDTAFLRVLDRRLAGLGWDRRVLAGPIPASELVSLRLGALLVDPAVLGAGAWDWLERTCAALPDLPVIVCTEPSSVAQRVRGLRLGADDWITKPCHPEEVVARIEACVRRRRRAAPRPHAGAVSAGELEIRRDRFQAYAGERSAELTRREFELLSVLADARGRVVERDDVYARVWGYAMAHGDRSVDVFVRKLRQKLERVSPGWRYIHTHFGIGYRFDPEPVVPERDGGAA